MSFMSCIFCSNSITVIYTYMSGIIFCIGLKSSEKKILSKTSILAKLVQLFKELHNLGVPSLVWIVK